MSPELYALLGFGRGEIFFMERTIKNKKRMDCQSSCGIEAPVCRSAPDILKTDKQRDVFGDRTCGAHICNEQESLQQFLMHVDNSKSAFITCSDGNDDHRRPASLPNTSEHACTAMHISDVAQRDLSGIDNCLLYSESERCDATATALQDHGDMLHSKCKNIYYLTPGSAMLEKHVLTRDSMA